MKLIALFLAFIASLLVITDAYSASVTISNTKAQLTSPDEEYTADVNLSISASNGTTYYLRGVFYKPGTSNYCGYTWNGSSWFNGPYTSNEGWKQFLSVSVNNSSWSGQLKAKIDTSDNSCKDSGTYNFKIQRFTVTSSSGNFDTQNEQTILITLPTLTPTPAPTSKPTSTPDPTSTPKPSLTLKPSSTITPLPTSKISPTTKSLLKSPIKQVHAAATHSASPTIIPSPTGTTQVLSADDVVPKVFIGVGLILIATCGILLYREKLMEIFGSWIRH